MNEYEELPVAERICLQLTRIANALESFQPDPEPETPDLEMPPCPHPLDLREDFGMTNGQPDWLCKACGFRTVPE